MRLERSFLAAWAAAALLLACGEEFDDGAGAAICGDGVVQPPEECDDQNGVDDDDCSNACRRRRCGDGILQAGEECDEGELGSDECSPDCRLPRCGDGFLQAGEACDDGNFDDHDACLNTCQLASCGDGVVKLGTEACDDGNADDDDGCTSDCRLTSCGDGIVQSPEQCDDGNVDSTDMCLSTCQLPFCGDGFVHLGVEECDDQNADDHDSCTTSCLLARCGDGLVQVGVEQCDDGNADSSDGCLSTCRLPSCGDGFVQLGVEECDDGNAFDTDSCRSDCHTAYCGDGAVWAGLEACDDGNADSTDGCTSWCSLPSCGDGFVQEQAGEECDDQNADNTDGCLLICLELSLCDDFGISSVQPPASCVGSLPATLTLTASGYGFLIVDAEPPAVTLAGAPVAVVSLDGCAPLPGLLQSIQGCSTMEIAIDPALSEGSYPIEVINPITEHCPASYDFDVTFAPNLSSVTPNVVCEGTPFDLALGGSGFVPATQVSLSGPIPAQSTTFVDSSSLLAAFAGVPAGFYDVTVSNGPACDDTLPGALEVLPEPMVFFVDPLVVYNGINLQVTIYVSGINGGDVTDVSIRPTGTSDPFQPLPSFTYDPLMANRIQAVVPSGLSPGGYDVLITDALSCQAQLLAGLTVVDDTALVIALDRIVPPFGEVATRTGVTIYAVDPLPVGMVGFQPVPSVYLNPNNPGPNDLAAPLSAVSYVDWDRLNGVVPATLPADDYDVIVVNPDGTVGVLLYPDGFTITTAPPPVIDSISPVSVPNNAPQQVVIYGSGFASPTVELYCDGVATPYAVTVNTASPSELNTTVPADQLAIGAVCVIRVTNPDGSYGEFSALGATEPAENLQDTVPEPSMLTARRAPAVVIGAATGSAVFMYAIGGDSGSVGGAFADIEAVPLDCFGNLGSWRPVPGLLPAPRTLARAEVVGRHIFLVGGNNGTGPVASVLRAEILDPLDSPYITDVSLVPAAGGLTQGIWYYRVAAVMGPGDPDNPGGETLPSDPQAVQIPAGLPMPLQVTVFYSAVAGATEYRIYRSPAAGAGLGNEELLATVAAPTVQHTDTGAATNPAQRPLQIGDLGVWRTMPALQQPREGFGLTRAIDPATGATWYLYAIGGRTSGATAVNSYEYLPVAIATGLPPAAATWTLAAANPMAGMPRWQLGAFRADKMATTRIDPADTWIYAGSGVNSAGTMVETDFDAALVLPGGALDTWIAVDKLNSLFAGYGQAAVANQLWVFGGQGAGVSTLSRSNHICGIGRPCGGAPPDPPDLENWDAGFLFTVPRYLLGSAVGSGRIFLVGGLTTGNVPTASVESTVW